MTSLPLTGQGCSFHLRSWTLCPTAQRVKIALTERGATFEQDIDEDATRALLTVQRPGQPAVQITEPLAMIELVEDLYADRPLHPADPLERASHRAMMELGQNIQSRLSVLSRASDPTDHDMAVHLLREQLARAERRLGTEFRPGSEVSNVDIVLAPTLWRLLVLDRRCRTHLLAGFPKLNLWGQTLLERPAIHHVLTEGAEQIYLETLARRGALIADSRQAESWDAVSDARMPVRGAG